MEKDIWFAVSQRVKDLKLIKTDFPKTCYNGKLLYIGFQCLECDAMVICEACNHQELQKDLKEFFQLQ